MSCGNLPGSAIAYAIGRANPLEFEGSPSLLFKCLEGTCVSIGRGYALTAAHVIDNCERNAAKYPEKTIAVIFALKTGKLGSCSILEKELFPELDLALLKLDLEEEELQNHYSPLCWEAKALSIFQDVQCLGYVDGLPSERVGMPVRGFKGYVMCPTRIREHSSNSPGYELSFPALGGLSGAPLLIVKRGKRFNAGYIIGNRTASYLGDEYKSHTALAVSTKALLCIRSEMLGQTFLDFLSDSQLLSSPRSAS